MDLIEKSLEAHRRNTRARSRDPDQEARSRPPPSCEDRAARQRGNSASSTTLARSLQERREVVHFRTSIPTSTARVGQGRAAKGPARQVCLLRVEDHPHRLRRRRAFPAQGGLSTGPEDPLVRPGYYWLAYEWSNLLFCCQLCNQRFKGNHFPLADATRRASVAPRRHRERAAAPHPSRDRRSGTFLEFDEEYVRPIDGHPRGEATIEILGLNREEIVEKRRDVLGLIKDLDRLS